MVVIYMALHPRLYVTTIYPVSVDGFRQTFVTSASWDKNELRFGVKGQGHIIAAEAFSTRHCPFEFSFLTAPDNYSPVIIIAQMIYSNVHANLLVHEVTVPATGLLQGLSATTCL